MKFRELDNLLVYEFLKNFALSLIGIFIPVYIISEGMGLFPAALFLILSGISGMILSYPVSRAISRLGFKHSLIASYFFLIPGLVVIRFFELSLAVIAVSAVLYNVGQLLHRISLNSEFAIDSDQGRRSEDSGKMLSLPNISRVVAPVAGGLIFAGLGFTQLLAITIFIMLLSAVPLLRSKEHRDPLEYSFTNFLDEEYIRTGILFVVRGIQGTASVAIFSLFVYMTVGGSIDVGGARALDSLGFVFTGLLVGYYSSRLNKQLFVTVGAFGSALTYVFRGFVATPLQVFLVSFVSGIFFQIYHVPIFSGFADQAENTDVLEFYTLNKIFSAFGKLIVTSTLVAFLFIYDLETGFRASFILAAAASLLMALVYRKIQFKKPLQEN